MEYAGQPERFAPGQYEQAFHVVFEAAQSPSWTLGDTTVTADRNTNVCSSPVQAVEPLVECVSEVSRNLSIATLGYHNPNGAPVAIATSRLNRMLGQQDQGQPTVFLPGRHEGVFAVRYAHALMWTLGSQRLRADRNIPTCRPALEAVQPLLDCVSHNGDGTYTAHFGYHNPNEVAISFNSRIHNQFLPAFPGLDEAPTTFEPGRHERVFSLAFRGQRLEWKLMDNAVTATRSAALDCQNAANARMAGLTDSGLEVYPNPFSKTVKLRLSEQADDKVHLRLFTLSGIMLLKENKTGSSGNIPLDLEQLGAGTYILEVKTGEVLKRMRILKH